MTPSRQQPPPQQQRPRQPQLPAAALLTRPPAPLTQTWVPSQPVQLQQAQPVRLWGLHSRTAFREPWEHGSRPAAPAAPPPARAREGLRPARSQRGSPPQRARAKGAAKPAGRWVALRAYQLGLRSGLQPSTCDVGLRNQEARVSDASHCALVAPELAEAQPSAPSSAPTP